MTTSDGRHLVDTQQWSERLIDEFYELVGTETALDMLLSRMRQLFSAQQGLIQTSPIRGDQRGVNLAASGVAHASLIEYHVHFEFEDIWTQRGLQLGLLGESVVIHGGTIVPPAELHQTRFWRDFLARHQVVDMLCGILDVPNQPGMAPTVITLHRTGVHPMFDQHDVARLRMLMPHLRRMLQLQRRLAPNLALGHTMEELFEQLEVPMCFVDASSCFVGGNRAAQHALSNASFLCIDDTRQLRWRCAGSKGWCSLRPELEALDTTPSLERMLVAESGQACIGSVLLARNGLQSISSMGQVSALVSLRPIDLERDATLVRQRFSLTSAEWAVALLLWKGADANSAAVKLGTRLSTTRTHIANLLQKTESDRQVLMLARLQGRAL